jgi:hypothetical protein
VYGVVLKWPSYYFINIFQDAWQSYGFNTAASKLMSHTTKSQRNEGFLKGQ